MATGFVVIGRKGKREFAFGPFGTREEADTFSGIEGTQMENDGVKFRTVELELLKV